MHICKRCKTMLKNVGYNSYMCPHCGLYYDLVQTKDIEKILNLEDNKLFEDMIRELLPEGNEDILEPIFKYKANERPECRLTYRCCNNCELKECYHHCCLIDGLDCETCMVKTL